MRIAIACLLTGLAISALARPLAAGEAAETFLALELADGEMIVGQPVTKRLLLTTAALGEGQLALAEVDSLDLTAGLAEARVQLTGWGRLEGRLAAGELTVTAAWGECSVNLSQLRRLSRRDREWLANNAGHLLRRADQLQGARVNYGQAGAPAPRLVARLADGSILFGEAGAAALAFESGALGRLELPLDRLQALEPAAAADRLVACTTDGTTLEGALTAPLELQTAFGPVAVAPDQLRELRVHGGNWTGRCEFTVNNEGEELLDFSLRLTVPPAPELRPDFADLRFADGNDTPLGFWVERVGETGALVWVRLPRLPPGESTLVFYYGNPRARSASDGEGAFLFFDDFTGDTVDERRWRVQRPESQRVANGRLHTDTFGTHNASLLSNRPDAAGPIPQAAIEERVMVTAVEGNVRRFSLHCANDGGFRGFIGWMDDNQVNASFHDGQSWGQFATGTRKIILEQPALNTFYIYRQVHRPEYMALQLLDDDYRILGGMVMPGLGGALRSWEAGYSQEGHGRLETDWVRVRRYPAGRLTTTVRLGDEERVTVMSGRG